MDSKKLEFSEDARDKIAKGVTTLAKAVKATLGPRGRNVVIQRKNASPHVTKDGVTVAKSVVLKDEFENIGAQMVKEVALKTADVAGDGPQPLHAKIYTPNGYTTMGDVKVGDSVCGTNGSTQKVLGVFPKGKKELCQVVLSDGRIVECCEDHLFEVTTNYGKKKVLTVREMVKSNRLKMTQADGSYKHGYYLPIDIPEFDKKNLPLDPYLLGLLLGDGSLTGKSKTNVELSIGYNKLHVLDKINLPKGISFTKKDYPNKNYVKVRFVGKTKEGLSMKDYLDSICLLGVDSHSKFIPNIYLTSRIEDRKALLQGLIDTDGHVNKRGLFEFSTVSESLFDSVKQLAWSLGISINTDLNTKRAGGYSQNPIFKISELKGYKHGIKIVDIIYTGKKVEMKCIKVSNPDHLYFTDGFVLTHNTTTATILAEAIFKEGMKLVAADHDPMSLKRGIDKAVAEVIKNLETLSKEVVSTEEIEQVATISANGDSEVGKMIAEAMRTVGKDGVITLEEGGALESSLKVAKGYEFDRGYLSPHFCNDPKQKVVFEDALVWLVNGKVAGKNMLDEMLPALEYCSNNGKPLVLIAETIEGDVLQTLLVNNLRQVLKCVCIKAPGFGDRRKEMLGDIAALTGATLRDPEFGGSLVANMSEEDFGVVKRIEVYADSTVLTASDDVAESVEARVAEVRAQLEQETDSWDRERTQQRLGKLVGGVGVITVGGATEIEMKEKKDRLEDALAATKAAVEEGIVPGGGVALARASKVLESFSTGNDEEDFGVKIVKNAIRIPLYQIAENSGAQGDVRVNDVLKEEGSVGFDAYRGQMVDMFDAGIVDPRKVTRVALLNAASIASLMLTTECVIAFEEEDTPQAPNPMMMG